MFVISLISDGRLKKTQIKSNANEAVVAAQKWHEEHKASCSGDDYIAIDQGTKKAEENIRFAELNFNQEASELKVFFNDPKDNMVFATKYADVTKTIFAALLEFALDKLTEYLRDRNQKGRKK